VRAAFEEFAAAAVRRPRILVAKLVQDGHDRVRQGDRHLVSPTSASTRFARSSNARRSGARRYREQSAPVRRVGHGGRAQTLIPGSSPAAHQGGDDILVVAGGVPRRRTTTTARRRRRRDLRPCTNSLRRRLEIVVCCAST